jgi:hypothetical protein
MPVMWKKKSEIIEEENAKINSNMPPIQIDFQEDDGYQRIREKSKTEKVFQTFEKAAIGLTKARLKVKHFWVEKIKKQSDADQLFEIDPETDREKFHRLISFTFSDKYLDEFISVVQALGFKDLGGFEYLGRRDADYSMAMNYNETDRLHFRGYRIHGIMFILIHHEPKASQDIKLHIKGYFDRLLYSITHQKKDGSTDQKMDVHGSGDGKEQIELSNYEKGSDIFLKMLKEQVPNFYQKLNAEIGDEELKIWREYLGMIDHLSPEQLIIENIEKNARMVPAFEQIRDSAKKGFELLNFHTAPAWDLKVPASNKYFIAHTIEAQKDFEILVITEDLFDEITRLIGLLRSRYQPKFILLIVPDLAIFGPQPDDIPPEGIEIVPYNQNRIKDLLNFLADAQVSVMNTSLFIDLLKIHLERPLRYSHIILLLTHKGLLKPEMLQELFQENNANERFLNAVYAIFKIFKMSESEKWISIKNLQKEAKKLNIELTESEINNILILMENSLVELLESKHGKHEDFRFLAHLTEEQIEFRVKKMKKMIEEFLIEQEEKISYM